MYTESKEKMPLLTEEKDTMLICFDETEKKVEPQEGEPEFEPYTMYCYESVRINKTDMNYSKLVSAIIREHYTEDDVEAIVLNGNDTEAHAEQLANLQTWRTHAKEVAKEVLNMD